MADLPLDRLFGLRAKRLADLIGEQGRDAYAVLNIDVDAKWNSLIMALSEQNATSTELATRTGLSRQLVESRIRKMEDEGLVLSDVDDEDARRRLYSLNPAHKRKVAEVHKAMANFEAVYTAIWAEIGMDADEALKRLEAALHDRSLTQRYADMFSAKTKRRVAR